MSVGRSARVAHAGLGARVIVVTDDGAGESGVVALLASLEAAPLEVRRHTAVLLRLPSLSDERYRALSTTFVARAMELGLLPMLHGLRGRVVQEAGSSPSSAVSPWVHLPERDWRLAGAHSERTSVACHDRAGAHLAASRGAGAIFLSPIFETPGKGASVGTSLLAQLRSELARDVSLVALGGISEENADGCSRAGADAIAVIRAVVSAPDPAAALVRLHASMGPRSSPERTKNASP